MVNMRKLLLLVVSLLVFSGMSLAQDFPKPHWAKNVPFAPREAGYIFSSGKGTSENIPQAEKKAFADAVKTALLELGEVELSAQKIQDIEENGLEAAVKYSSNRKIRQARITEPVLLASGKWLVYVLIQVQEDGETPVRFNYLPEGFSTEDENFSNAVKVWNENTKKKIVKENKKDEIQENVSGVVHTIGGGVSNVVKAIGGGVKDVTKGEPYFSLDITPASYYDGLFSLGFSGKTGGFFGIGFGIKGGIGIDNVSFSFPNGIILKYYKDRDRTFERDAHSYQFMGIRNENDHDFAGARLLYSASVRLYAFKNLFLSCNYGTHTLNMVYADNDYQTLTRYYDADGVWIDGDRVYTYYKPNFVKMKELRDQAAKPTLHWSLGYDLIMGKKEWKENGSSAFRFEVGWYKNPLTNQNATYGLISICAHLN